MNRRLAIKAGTLAIGGAGVSTLQQLISPQIVFAQEQPLFGALSPEPLLSSELMGLAAPPNAAVLKGSGRNLALSSVTAKPPAASELANQFIAFQTAIVDNKPVFLESSNVNPSIETPDDNPDVMLGVSLQSFHLGENESVAKETRATMRLTLSKDEDSTRGKGLENVFWTITAGLKLFNDVTNRRSESVDHKADLTRAFGNRSIEIPGALGNLKLEVIKHKEPSWWQQIFRFIESDAGRALTAALGFPAVTQQVVRFVDQAANQFQGGDAQVLFASRPMKIAFSKQARANFQSDGPVKIGCLNPGFWVLARGRDFATLSKLPAYYYPTYGKLVPTNIPIEQAFAPGYDDPYKNMTYAVLKVQMRATKLDFSFS